jgi:hypothetical protein
VAPELTDIDHADQPELALKLAYTDFIQGDSRVTLEDFAVAAATAADNPDEFLHRIVAQRAEDFIAWSLLCVCVDLFLGIAGAVGQGGSLLLVVDQSGLRPRPRSPRRARADHLGAFIRGRRGRGMPADAKRSPAVISP